MKNNIDLKPKYNAMWKQGPSAWNIPPTPERNMIYNLLAGSWEGKSVLEIGCGEGKLAAMLDIDGANVLGLDYSEVALREAQLNYPKIAFRNNHWTQVSRQFDALVMQGVLEHLDEPWKDLKWIVDNLLKPKGSLITTSPCFLNPRGFLWMFLYWVYQVPMSLTDLHFLNPWEFEDFADHYDLELKIQSCHNEYGFGTGLYEDFKDRIPKAHEGHKTYFSMLGFVKWLKWLEKANEYMQKKDPMTFPGATAGYKFWRE